MEIPDHIYTLIAKRLDQEANAEETAALESWLAEDMLNAETFLQLKKIHRASATYLQQPVNTAAAWQKIDGKINSNTPVVKMSFAKLLSVAAILLVAIVAAWFAKGLLFDESWEKSTAVSVNMEQRLPDGTIVWIRKGGTLEWRADFDENRQVKLYGEAFFDVAHNAAHPFSVRTGQSITTVLGTSFSIRSVGGFDQVIVTRGKVNVEPVTDNKPAAQLLPGDKLVLSKDKLMRSSVSDSNYLAWKTGVLHFRDVKLDRALRAVSDLFQVSVQGDATSNSANTSLTASFENQPLNKVLDTISLLTGLEHNHQADGSYLFSRK
jgi:transmembrane sensor